jgi:hypothetical protein
MFCVLAAANGAVAQDERAQEELASAASLPSLAVPSDPASLLASDPALDAPPSAPRRDDQLDPAATLTIRPAPQLRRLAERVARMLALRAAIAVEVGDAPPPMVIEAVPATHVGLAPDGAEVVVVLGGPGGLLYQSRVDLPAGRDSSVRAIALAIEALRDAAIEGPPPPPEPGAPQTGVGEAARGERVTFVYLEAEGGLFGVRRRVEPQARPTIYLRALLGFSTARQTVLVGPGVGVGLCLGDSCVVLEGDLPLVPEERELQVSRDTVERVYYRPVSLGMRGQIRPWRWGDVLPALTIGVLTRFGNAWIPDVTSQTVTDFGLRASLELAWIFAAPFEIVVELGGDFVANPAVFLRARGSSAPIPVILEDQWTLWGMTSIRLRP